jgi:hypothetical protein
MILLFVWTILLCQLKQNKKEKVLCNYAVKFYPYINSISRLLSFQKMNIKNSTKEQVITLGINGKKYYLHRLSYYFVLE